ncbi:putative short-chain dehydrogenase reductase family protein [Seiridium unicorne]|uniref:Short-chain dehydrogenase reductase family protein n=1 Tax=Seiridium unicorne TaxID=138068 RepID=A0ABR2UFW5_9PEZI
MASPVGSLALTPEEYTFPKIFYKHQIRPNPKPSLGSNSVAGQTAVITGGNTGIGLECGRLLLSLKLSHLILAVRSLQKGEEAAEPLRKLYPTARIDVWHLDMNSYDSIRAFGRNCATLARLDIAILSAGIMNVKLEVNSSTGHEEMFQVNYLSAALLALVLLPVLKKKTPSGTPGRLTLVASGAALIAEFSERNAESLLPAFDKQEGWGSSVAKKRYDTTKGLVLMLTLKLSQITKAEDTIINVVDPTFTPGTAFFRNLPFLMRVFAWPLTILLGTSVNNAAWRYIDATVARGKESHGSFLSDWEIHPFHPFMYTEEGNKFMDRLWNETVQELDFPELRQSME